jgi:catechol 2,3-dioxygenase-like lactoylglutathione lyase family enzyme
MQARIRHIAIASANSELLLDFYGSVFGLPRDEQGPIVYDGYVGLNVNPRGKGRQAGIDHFGFEVEDVDAIVARSKAAYPDINFLKRPGNRNFVGFGTHDPAGNVFDLSQAGMENRRGFYAGSSQDWLRRHINHFVLRAVNPELLAEFYQTVYGLQLERTAADDPTFPLTDGRVTLVIAPWNILDYAGTGVERPAIEHLGFAVESLDAFRRDLDNLMESRPELFPAFSKESTEGARRMEILAGCRRGELRLNDPDGVLLDVGQA